MSAPAPPSSLPFIQLPTPPEEVAAEDLLEAHVPTKLELEPADLDIPVIEPSPAPAASMSPVAVTEAFDMTSYFAKRDAEARQGGEAGLLPIAPAQRNKDAMGEEGMRQRLLGGQQKGMGARELQEELSGQLAGVSGKTWTALTDTEQMSHQLKLNALQFSQSLENEKELMKNSQDVLERELDGFGVRANDCRKSRRYAEVEREFGSRLAQGTQHDVHAAWDHGHGPDAVHVDLHAHQVHIV